MIKLQSAATVLTFFLSLVFLSIGVAKGEQYKNKEAKGNKGEMDCSACQGIEGYIPPHEISQALYQMVGKMRKGNKSDDVRVQKERGGIQTGTYPKFIDEGKCPTIDSEKWAIDYSHKRGGAAIHKGVDIPQPKGTPVLAVSSGTVIGKFMNKHNRKGIEVVLRHTPEDTGLPFYTYTQYTHLLEMSPLPIGASVKMGDEIAKIWNTGKMGKKIRRTALHFAVMYSESPDWTNDGTIVVPQDSYWMDPVFFYSNSGPYDSMSVKKVADKAISIPYINRGGTVAPSETKRIWPFACK
jgi:hypothetical protein